jgi:hypothetical protein
MARSKRAKDWQRWGAKGSTTQRGYGWPHRKLREALLARWRPGDPCARCGQPMLYRWIIGPDGKQVSAIDLGHTEDRTGYTGLEHRACNRTEGARRGRWMQSGWAQGRSQGWPQSRRW